MESMYCIGLDVHKRLGLDVHKRLLIGIAKSSSATVTRWF